MTTSPLAKDKTRFPLWKALRLIDDVDPRGGAQNMALDEVLLGRLSDVPILRCYRWREREVSFGCFGHVAEVERAHPGIRRVRRWTGGGMVEHGKDFTFTLLVPRSLPFFRQTASDSYQSIHAMLALAMRNAGFSDLESADNDALVQHQAVRDAPFLKPCFSNPVEHDLLVQGEKIAGGAQRRTRQGLLHQGSVQIPASVVGFDEQVRAILMDSLARALSSTVTVHPISDADLDAANRLAEQKYGGAAWTNRF